MHQLVLNNRFIKVYKLEETTNVINGSTERLLQDHLHTSMVSADGCPNADVQESPVPKSCALLAKYNHDSEYIHSRYK